jgi:hypothetical protein
MSQTQEQVVEVLKEEEVGIVELSQADLVWIGGGTGPIANADY